MTCSAKDLPAKFTDALDAALTRAALTVERLAIKVDVTNRLIYRWLNGTRTPSVESLPALRKIENALSLPPDTLVSRVIRTRAKQFAHSCYPEHIFVDGEEVKLRGNKKVLLFLRPLLPDDYSERPMEERTEIATWLFKNLVRPTTAWAQWHRPLCTLPHAMKVFPPVVQKEWGELSIYKRDKLPPLGMKRNGSWSEDSASQYEDNFRRLMAYLTLSTGTEDSRFRGLGLDQSHLTLAAITCYPLIDGYFRWQARRRKDGPSVQSYSLADLHFVQMIIKLLSSEGGRLRQKPELAEHLKPLPGFIDEHFIERARTDWNGLCDEAVAEYIHLAASIEEVAEEQRDPFEPILLVLDLDHPQYHDPISALRHFSQNIINDLPDPSGAPIKAANQVRNYLIVRVLSITGLRSRNIRELTYREDNTGQLRRKGDKWVVVIPWHSRTSTARSSA
jgi:transcriptional regulator with XRE-family HTH domain